MPVMFVHMCACARLHRLKTLFPIVTSVQCFSLPVLYMLRYDSQVPQQRVYEREIWNRNLRFNDIKRK